MFAKLLRLLVLFLFTYAFYFYFRYSNRRMLSVAAILHRDSVSQKNKTPKYSCS